MLLVSKRDGQFVIKDALAVMLRDVAGSAATCLEPFFIVFLFSISTAKSAPKKGMAIDVRSVPLLKTKTHSFEFLVSVTF